jgi:hemerythrin
MLAWEGGYKIGHEEMDAEHLFLFAMLNQLDINIREHREAECLRDVLNALRAYIDYHFAHEELLMKAWDYPAFDAHEAMHQRFVSEIARLRAEVGEHDMAETALKLRDFIRGWLLSHILEADAEYAAFIAFKTRR